MKYIASVSFGKDSLAMLLLLIRNDYPLDEVVFYDTEMEFQAIYNLRDKVEKLLNKNAIKYVELKTKESFEYNMYERPVCKRGTNIVHKYGYGWCGGTCRWGTTAKLQALEKYCKGHYEYVGIAVDEPKRLAKDRKGNKLFPLAEWNLNEKYCLEYCYEQGYHWIENGIELYNILDRVSCWCCRNKNLKELRNMYMFLPEYWQKLKNMQLRLPEPMKGRHSVFDLEKKFDFEQQREMKGLSITSRDFYIELNQILMN